MIMYAAHHYLHGTEAKSQPDIMEALEVALRFIASNKQVMRAYGKKHNVKSFKQSGLSAVALDVRGEEFSGDDGR